MATPPSKIEVRLSAEQRAALDRLVHTGTHPAHARRRASILLRADADGPDAWPDERIAEALDINRNTVWRVRAQFVAEGLDAALHKKKADGPPVPQARRRPGGPARRPGLLPTARGPGPLDHEATLAERLVELEVVEAIDPSTVWRTLKKTRSSRG